MIVFIIAVLALLGLAVVLAHKLARPADTLGLRAARHTAAAEIRWRVYTSNMEV